MPWKEIDPIFTPRLSLKRWGPQMQYILHYCILYTGSQRGSEMGTLTAENFGMEKKQLIGLAMGLLTFLGSSCSTPPRGIFPYEAGVIDLRGEPASLALLRGRPVVFATYVASMPDCRKRIERFVALSDAFRGAEVRFVAVDIRARSLLTIEADASAFDPKAKVPSGLPLKKAA